MTAPKSCANLHLHNALNRMLYKVLKACSAGQQERRPTCCCAASFLKEGFGGA